MKHLTIISRRGREMRCLFCIFLLASLLHIVFLKGFMWDPRRLLPFFLPFNYDKLSNCVLFYCTLQLGIWERPTYIMCFKLLGPLVDSVRWYCLANVSFNSFTRIMWVASGKTNKCFFFHQKTCMGTFLAQKCSE